MPSEFYMEIGCEEIPARTMARSLNDLRDRVEKLLQEEKLTYDRVEAIGSARRFVVRVPALAERQESRSERIMGPPASIAFKDGQPAPPLVGFAKKNNVAVEALQKFATDKGEYYGIESTIEGGSAADILAKGLPAIVRAMTFPKMMIWMDPSLRFSRPLRWIISRFGEQRIPMELFGVHSAGYSEGHRILGSGRVEVTTYADFVEKLEKNFVIVSQEERRKKIERELNEEVGRLNGRIIGDDKLLEEVVYINEYPTIVRGRFEERFLELPREILITVHEGTSEIFRRGGRTREADAVLPGRHEYRQRFEGINPQGPRARAARQAYRCDVFLGGRSEANARRAAPAPEIHCVPGKTGHLRRQGETCREAFQKINTLTKAKGG
jgi:glycyl-tRNA synthetase beta chain